MTIEIGILIALCGGIIGLLTFLFTRHNAAKAEGERWGQLEAKVDMVLRDLTAIKETNSKGIEDAKESVRRVYTRMDERFEEHLRLEHGRRAGG